MTATAAPLADAIEPTGTRPFAGFEWMMALRYLRSRRRRRSVSAIAAISFLSFALGVFALIVIMAVMNGLRAELQCKILGFKGHIEVSARDTPMSDFAEVAQKVAAVPGVTLAFPYLEEQALASSRYNAGGVFVRGLRAEDVRRLPGLAENIKEGSLESFDKGQGILIGMALATQLGLQVGDNLMLLAPSANSKALGTPPRAKAFPISGLFEVGHSDIDSNYVMMPLPLAQQYFGRGEDVTGIEVYVQDPARLTGVSSGIIEQAGRPVTLLDWTQRDRTLFTALVVERNVMFVILVLIIIVAAFNIVSNLIMMVRDKSSDIAILRTMGASRGSILRVFMITGSAIGFMGTLAGFVLGLSLAANVEGLHRFIESTFETRLFPSWLYFLVRLPAKIDTSEVVTVVIAALVLSVTATIYPALRAARLDPVEALRYE